MLYNNNNSSNYAQIGYIRKTEPAGFGGLSTCMIVLAAYNVGGGQVTGYGSSCLAVDAYYNFKVRYTGPVGPYPSSSNWPLVLDFNGSNFMGTPATPWYSGWSNYPAFFGEGQYADTSDIPGIATAAANQLNLKIQAVDTGAFIPLPCYMRNDIQHPRYHTGAYDCQNVYMYSG